MAKHPFGRFKLAGDKVCCNCCPDGSDTILFDEEFPDPPDENWQVRGSAYGYDHYGADPDITFSFGGSISAYSTQDYDGTYVAFYARPMCAQQTSGFYMQVEAQFLAFPEHNKALNFCELYLGAQLGPMYQMYHAIMVAYLINPTRGWNYVSAHDSDVPLQVPEVGDTLGVRLEPEDGTDPDDPVVAKLLVNDTVLWTSDPFSTIEELTCVSILGGFVFYSRQLVGGVGEFGSWHFESS